MPLEHQDPDSIPGPAQWVKDPGLWHLQHRLQLQLRSDPGPGTPYTVGKPKRSKTKHNTQPTPENTKKEEKKKKKKKKKMGGGDS